MQWVWGKAGERWRRSEGRAAHSFGHSGVRDHLSNARTRQNPDTALWHSNVSAPSARKLFLKFKFKFVFSATVFFSGEIYTYCVHFWFQKAVSVAEVITVLLAERSRHIGLSPRVTRSGCGARPGSGGGGLRAGPPTHSVTSKLESICRDPGHLKTKVP